MRGDHIDGMEEFYGRKLKQEYMEHVKDSSLEGKYIIARPTHYKSEDIHINMYIRFDDTFKITSIDGDKCYSRYKGMYNRSSAVFDRKWSKKDMLYLKKLIRTITEV